MALRKKIRGENKPAERESPTPRIRDNKKRSEVISKAAKDKKLGGKVELTEDQKRRKAANKSKRQWKPSEEAEAIALWESGEFTLSELASKFNRNADSLSRFFTTRGLTKGSKAEEYAKAVHERVMSQVMGDVGETATKVKNLKDDYLTRFEIAKKLTHNEIATVQKRGLSLQSALPNLRAIKQYIDILSHCRTEEYDLLGVAEFESRIEHDDLPELVISELTVEDIEKMRVEQLKLSSMDEIDIDQMDEFGDDKEKECNEVISES